MQYIKKPEFYTGLIYSMSLAWSQKTGVDFHEFVCEGNFAYYDAKRLFNPEKGVKFCTFLRIKINWGMARYANFCRGEVVPLTQEIPDYCLMSDWDLMVDSLSKRSKEIVQLLKRMPSSLQKMIDKKYSRGITKWILREWLTSHKHWKHSEVDEAFREIKEVLC